MSEAADASSTTTSDDDDDENTKGLSNVKNVGHGDSYSAFCKSGITPDAKTVSNEELLLSTKNSYEVLQCQVIPNLSFNLLVHGNHPSASSDIFKGGEIDESSEISRLHKDGGDADMQKCILVSEAEEEDPAEEHNLHTCASASESGMEKPLLGFEEVNDGNADAEDEVEAEVVNTALSPPQINYVVDYRDFRRKGYFLEDNNSSRPPKVSTELSNIELVSPKDFVVEWLSGLPENTEELCLGDSEYGKDDDDVGQLHKSESITRYDMLSRFMTDEDHFKRLILKSGQIMRYSGGVLNPALTNKQLESMVEGFNKKLNEQLSRPTKVSQVPPEYEYVSGTVRVPVTWNISEDILTTKKSSSNYLEFIFTWIRSLFQKGKNVNESDEKEEIVQPQSVVDVREVVLKPYHGPIILHGATIEAGSTNVAVKRGGIGKLMEEVKAVLCVIHKTLRKNPPVTIPPKPSETEQVHPLEEDPEIKKLTEMLLKARSGNGKPKSTLRSVFGFRKPVISRRNPPASNVLPRRLNEQGRNRFIRAVEGWVQRKRNGRGPIGRNRVNPVIQNQQQNVPPAAGNIVINVLAYLLNFIRSCVSRIASFFINTPPPDNAPEVERVQNNSGPSSRIPKPKRISFPFYRSHQTSDSRRRLWM